MAVHYTIRRVGAVVVNSTGRPVLISARWGASPILAAAEMGIALIPGDRLIPDPYGNDAAAQLRYEAEQGGR